MAQARCELGGGWQPEQEALSKIAGMLETNLDPSLDNQKRKMIAQEVDELSRRPEFARYLSFLYAESSSMGASEQLRYMSGLVLIKAVRTALNTESMTPDCLEHVKRSVLAAMSEKALQRSACALIPTIVLRFNLSTWPELVTFLRSALSQTQSAALFEGAFKVLEHLCEDCSNEVDSEILENFLPFLLEHFKNPEPEHRARAVKCVNYLLMMDDLRPAVSSSSEKILQGLSMLAQDTNHGVQKEVCVGLTYLLLARSDVVAPHIQSILTFMITCLQSEDEDVVMESLEFISTLCKEHHAQVAEPLGPYLPSLFPLLLKRMEFGEEELVAIGSDEENDTSIEDKAEDIRPSHHGGTAQRVGEDDSDSEDEFEEEEDADIASMWTARKLSGRVLEIMVRILPQEQVLPLLLPLLRTNLDESKPWLTRDAAVLALGVMSFGCEKELEQYLPELLSFLLKQAQGSVSHIRVTALWSLGRYSEWVKRVNGTGQPGDGLLREFVLVFTQATMDRNKRVQLSACSAIATFAEVVEDALDPYVQDMCGVLLKAYATYQANNRKSMLDTFGALFACAPRNMCQPAVFTAVVPVLWEDFSRLNESDLLGLHYMETFGCIVKEAGVSFAQFCKPLYNRAVQYIEGTMTFLATAPSMGLSTEEVDREFLYGALELISALCEGLKSHVAELIDFSSFLSLLDTVLKDDDELTLETAFALCGDLAASAPQGFAPLMPTAIDVMLDFVYPPDHDVNVCNNAVWAIGEIAKCLGDKPTPGVNGVTNKVVLLMCDNEAEAKLRNNAAITLGRLALNAPDVVSQHLDSCSLDWARLLSNMQSRDVTEAEKAESWRGFLLLIHKNPAGVAEAFNYLCLAATKLTDAEPQLLQGAVGALGAVKSVLQASGKWEAAYKSLGLDLAKELQLRNMLTA
eukprot:CAMPEP_0184550872 /NCGR_PEP_ID=MMETSP0199_2-20130426/22617_1 /TAXON_ID=1112570 /ORGANISM="Thraustochytrium sp., Strain LLF1b" /LENGTH=915 /DNA_ID=CAMNT_0026945879 /DNA_START=108 /DNA_END=2855 /DNA_ORIENTATION=-